MTRFNTADEAIAYGTANGFDSVGFYAYSVKGGYFFCYNHKGYDMAACESHWCTL